MSNRIIDSLAKPNKYPILFTFVFSLIFSIASTGLSSLILEGLCGWLETISGYSKLLWQILITLVLSILLLLLISNVFTFLFSDKKLITQEPEELTSTFKGLIVFGSYNNPNPPAIEAIKHHWNNGNGKLEHCWIISGGTDALNDTDKWVKQIIQNYSIPNRVFHFQSDYKMDTDEVQSFQSPLVPNLKESNDPNVIRRIIEAIYQDAKNKYDLEEEDIIADYTGGTKSMTAGLTLACSNPSRRLEYITSEYDRDGKPMRNTSKLMEIKLSYRIKSVKSA
jgi:hypothetical protein